MGACLFEAFEPAVRLPVCFHRLQPFAEQHIRRLAWWRASDRVTWMDFDDPGGNRPVAASIHAAAADTSQDCIEDDFRRKA